MSLGDFKQISKDSKTMKFEGGNYCHGKGDRRSDVKMACGDNELISAISEPETCFYEVVFETPVACSYSDVIKFFNNF